MSTVSSLRQRMIEDMNARKQCAGPRRGHIHAARNRARSLASSNLFSAGIRGADRDRFDCRQRQV
jgi:hypothetical protein